MHTEIERKFLVLNDSYKVEAVKAIRMRQGYIARQDGRTVRVRISDEEGWLTIKGPSMDGISRQEWETGIPLADANELLGLSIHGIIDKVRHIIPVDSIAPGPAGGHEGRFFEVDEFLGDNEGLTVAEIELGSHDEAFPHPSWLGPEVTGDRRYYNSQLSRHPFKEWK